MDALRASVDEAEQRVAELARLLVGWQELMENVDEPEKSRAGEVLRSFQRDLEEALSGRQNAKDAFKQRLLDVFHGLRGRTPESDQELETWLASPEGKAATAFETTMLDLWGGRGRS